MNKELVIAKLDLIAAKARELSISVREGRLWEGELARGVGQICSEGRELAESELVRKDNKR